MSVEKRKMVMGSYIDQKVAMEQAIASGKTVFTGPQAAIFNALRMSSMAPPVFVPTPACDGARALPSTFPPHVRASNGPSAAPLINPSSGMKCIADNADAQSPSVANSLYFSEHAAAPLLRHPVQQSMQLDQKSSPKPLLSFYSNVGAPDSAGSLMQNQQQQIASAAIPLLPASTLLSSDPSHFDTMLKDWTRKISGQSFGASSAACSSLPSAFKPAVFHVEADHDVLCIDSPIIATPQPVHMVSRSNVSDAALAVERNEVICVSSSDSDSETGRFPVTPLLAVQAAAADTSPIAQRTGETKSPTCNLTPRGILNFFSPVSKNSFPDSTAAVAGSSRASAVATGDLFSSLMPLIVNPVFTEVLAEAAATVSEECCTPSSVAADTHVQRPSCVSQLAPASVSHCGSVSTVSNHDIADSTATFSIIVSMVSGRNLLVELPSHLLQKNLVSSDDARGGGAKSPVDDPSPLVSCF